MIVAIGADHRGFKTKSLIANYLRRRGHKVRDYGTDSEESVDYPDVAWLVGTAVARKRTRYGILLCNSGQGMAMVANKVRGVRAALCVDWVYARFARAHNNANVLVMPAGFMPYGTKMRKIVDVFLNTRFEGGRHRHRIEKMDNYERSQHTRKGP